MLALLIQFYLISDGRYSKCGISSIYELNDFIFEFTLKFEWEKTAKQESIF